MKRGNLFLCLVLISILFISGCGPEMSPYKKDPKLNPECNITPESYGIDPIENLEIVDPCEGYLDTFMQGGFPLIGSQDFQCENYGGYHPNLIYNGPFDSGTILSEVRVINIYDTYATISPSTGVGCMNSDCQPFGEHTKEYDWGTMRVLSYNQNHECQALSTMHVCITPNSDALGYDNVIEAYYCCTSDCAGGYYGSSNCNGECTSTENCGCQGIGCPD